MTFKVILRYYFILVLVFLLQGACVESVAAAQEFFPFLAEISKDNVNVRAGQSENFEKLCQLNIGDEVVVVERNYSWYKVELPQIAGSYLSRKFVSLLDKSTGVLNAKRINIRAEAGIQATILCQMDVGDKVEILEATKDWYKIKPPQGCFGWVSDKLVKFKSKEVRINEPQKVEVSLKDKGKEVDENKKVNIAVPDTAIVEMPITITGFVARVPQKSGGNTSFKLVTKDKKVYYLYGLQHVLDEFLHHTIKVEGTLIKDGPGEGPYPAINIVKFQLVL